MAQAFTDSSFNFSIGKFVIIIALFITTFSLRYLYYTADIVVGVTRVV